MRALAQDLAEGAAAALAGKQAQQMAGDVLERDALREPSLDVRAQRVQEFGTRPQFTAEPRDIEPMQQVGIVVRGAAEHRAIGMRQVRGRFDFRGDPAVDDHLQVRSLALEPVGPLVTQRRHLAVFLRRQALEPGIARVDDEHAAASVGNAIDEGAEHFEMFVVIDAEAAFHRHRNMSIHGRARRDHRRDAVGDQGRLAHQARAEPPGLHAIGRAATVEVDLVEATLGSDPRRLRQQCRFAAAQLQCDRMLDRIQRQQLVAVAVDHRIRMHHLGVQPCVRRQQAMEHAAMRIRPVHHRGDGQAQLFGGNGGLALHRRALYGAVPEWPPSRHAQAAGSQTM